MKGRMLSRTGWRRSGVGAVLMVGLFGRPVQESGPLQLTNLETVSRGIGIPEGWELRRARGAVEPLFAVTADGALRIEATDAVGFLVFELPDQLPPAPGIMRWRWRSGASIPGANLRDRRTDDSPIRVIAAFADRRAIFYSWGNREPPGAAFRSWTSDDRLVIVAATAGDADGGWRAACHDPFADYRRAFAEEPPALVAVGVSADTEQLAAATWAEVGEIHWVPSPDPARTLDACDRSPADPEP